MFFLWNTKKSTIRPHGKTNETSNCEQNNLQWISVMWWDAVCGWKWSEDAGFILLLKAWNGITAKLVQYSIASILFHFAKPNVPDSSLEFIGTYTLR